MINDGGSCENAVSTYMVETLALKTVDHPEPYQFTWLNKRNAIKISKRCLVEFSVGMKYKDKVWCEVIPMDACHILLGFKKIKVRGRPEPYQFTWLKKKNAIKVSKRCLVEFSARRKYKDKVWCEVIPMDACHILLGFKKIKIRGRIIIMKGKLIQGIQSWMLQLQGMSKAKLEDEFF
nr:reverse transcriptase domain-containing protein [Tanacetum cinerariifolium]